MRKRYRYTMLVILLTALAWLPYGAKGQDSLNHYLEEAVANNPIIKADYQAYLAALERIPQVGALPDPQLSFGYFISPVETRVGPQVAKVGVMQMFPWLGTLSGREEAAALQAKAAYEKVEISKLELQQQVKEVYFQLIGIKLSKGIVQSHVDLVSTYETLATTRMENGEGSLVDVLQIQLQAALLEDNIQALDQRSQRLQAKMNQLLNRDAGQAIAVPEQLPNMPSIKSNAWVDSLAGNPMLKRLDWQQQSFEASRQVALKQGMPSIGIGLNYILVQERRDMDVPDNGKDIFQPAITVSLPLARQKYKAGARQQAIMVESTQLQIEATSDQLQTKAINAWSNYEDAKRKKQLHQSQIETIKQAISLQLQAYTTGSKPMEEVLRLEQMQLNQERDLIDTQVEMWLAKAQLEALF